MSEYACPLCGGKVVNNEVFCRSCQEIAKKSNPDKFVKKSSVSKAIPKKTIQEELDLVASENEEDDVEDWSQQDKLEKIGFLKDNRSLYMLLVFLLGAAISITYYYFDLRSHDREKALWEECIVDNTSRGYADYLKQYPTGEFITVAEERIRELQNLELIGWSVLKNSNDINALFSYLEEYPNTPYKNDVKGRIDRLAWESALKEQSADSFRSYIENVELGNYVGGFLDIAKKRYKYYSTLIVLEGEGRDKVLKQIVNIFQSITSRDVKSISMHLSATPSPFYRIRGLAKEELLDSLRRVYDKENEYIKQTVYGVLQSQTSIVKDVDDQYNITAAVTSKLTFKDKARQNVNDTLNFEIVLNDSLKVVKMEVIKK